MRKGQVEIMGLVIVVVLIVIGGLFYIKFAMIPDNDRENLMLHIDSIKANSLMVALANVDVCDGKYRLKELFSILNKPDVCNGKSGKEYLEEELTNLFVSLSLKNVYYYVLKDPERSPQPIFKLNECEYGVDSEEYVFFVDSQKFSSRVRFCSVLSTTK